MKSTKRKNKITKNPKETEKAVNRRKKMVGLFGKVGRPIAQAQWFCVCVRPTV